MNPSEENKAVKIPEKDDSDRDTNEDSDIDTDEDKRRDNRTRLKDYRRQLDKLWESTIEVSKSADAIAKEWKNEQKKLESANNKQLVMNINFNADDWLIDEDEEEKMPRPQFVSKIPKPTTLTKIPTIKIETNQSNIPIKTIDTTKNASAVVKNNNLIKPAKLLTKPK